MLRCCSGRLGSGKAVASILVKFCYNIVMLVVVVVAVVVVAMVEVVVVVYS